MVENETNLRPWLDTSAIPDYVRDRFAAVVANCITRMLREPDIRAEIMPAEVRNLEERQEADEGGVQP